MGEGRFSIGFGAYQLMLFHVAEVMRITVAEVMGVMINSSAPIRTGLLTTGKEDWMRERVMRQLRVFSHGGDPEHLHKQHFIVLLQTAGLIDSFLTVSDLDYHFSNCARTTHFTLTTKELWHCLEKVRKTREERLQHHWKKTRSKKGSTTSSQASAAEQAHHGLHHGQMTTTTKDHHEPCGGPKQVWGADEHHEEGEHSHEGMLEEHDEVHSERQHSWEEDMQHHGTDVAWEDEHAPVVSYAHLVARVAFAGTQLPIDKLALQHRKVHPATAGRGSTAGH